MYDDNPKELQIYTIRQRTSVNNVNGVLLTSTVNGNSIFLPNSDRYWLSEIWANNSNLATTCNIDSDYLERNGDYRCRTHLIRPVTD